MKFEAMLRPLEPGWAGGHPAMMASPAKTVLIVDDDTELNQFTARGLEFQGFVVAVAEDAHSGFIAAAESKPDVIVLGLAPLHQMEVLKTFQSWAEAPIIVISALAEDEVEAFKRGADDYIIKPFNVGELAARCEALLRRYRRSTASESVVRTGQLAIDLVSRSALFDGKPLEMSRKECRLLQFLASHCGSCVTHNDLIREIWGSVSTDHEHRLRLLVMRVRKKVEYDPGHPKLLRSISGVGYRLERVTPSASLRH